MSLVGTEPSPDGCPSGTGYVVPNNNTMMERYNIDPTLCYECSDLAGSSSPFFPDPVRMQFSELNFMCVPRSAMCKEGEAQDFGNDTYQCSCEEQLENRAKQSSFFVHSKCLGTPAPEIEPTHLSIPALVVGVVALVACGALVTTAVIMYRRRRYRNEAQSASETVPLSGSEANDNDIELTPNTSTSTGDRIYDETVSPRPEDDSIYDETVSQRPEDAAQGFVQREGRPSSPLGFLRRPEGPYDLPADALLSGEESGDDAYEQIDGMRRKRTQSEGPREKSDMV
jgi:hypothetical protein